LGVVAHESGAAVVFDNGGTTYGYGIEMSAYEQADDFKLTSAYSLTGARFWTIEGYGIRQTKFPFDGHIDYAFYPSVNGAPGATKVAGGVGQAVARTDTGLKDRFYGTLEGFEYSFDFEAPFLPVPGQTYFLGLHLLGSYPSISEHAEAYWSTSIGALQLSTSHGRPGGAGAWGDNGAGVTGVYGAGLLAFELNGAVAPEPGGAVALALGAWLATMRRPRRC
jgi:hypothetical protein